MGEPLTEQHTPHGDVNTNSVDYALGKLVASVERIETTIGSHGAQLADIGRNTRETNGKVAEALIRIDALDKRVDGHARAFQNVHRRVDALQPKTAVVKGKKEAESDSSGNMSISLSVSPRMWAALAGFVSACSVIMPSLVEFLKHWLGGLLAVAGVK